MVLEPFEYSKNDSVIYFERMAFIVYELNFNV